MLPHNKIEMQSFLSKNNFMRRFISDFAETIKPLQEMIKKDGNYKWTKDRKEAFEKIKEEIVEAPTLRILDNDKEFILYTFASNHSITVMLTHKDDVGEKFPISFMRMGLQGVELNYLAIDKQASAVFKAIKHFQPYILRSHTKVIVPHLAIRYFLIQKDPRDRRGNWLTSLQVYDLETKGQGLCNLAVEALDP